MPAVQFHSEVYRFSSSTVESSDTGRGAGEIQLQQRGPSSTSLGPNIGPGLMEDKDNKLDQPIFVLIGLGRLLTLLMYDPRHPEISSLCLSKFPANADTRDMEEASHLHY